MQIEWNDPDGDFSWSEFLRRQPVGHRYVPEQERNFDAGFMPSQTGPKFVREEWIDGKLYKVYQ